MIGPTCVLLAQVNQSSVQNVYFSHKLVNYLSKMLTFRIRLQEVAEEQKWSALLLVRAAECVPRLCNRTLPHAQLEAEGISPGYQISEYSPRQARHG